MRPADCCVCHFWWFVQVFVWFVFRKFWVIVVMATWWSVVRVMVVVICEPYGLQRLHRDRPRKPDITESTSPEARWSTIKPRLVAVAWKYCVSLSVYFYVFLLLWIFLFCSRGMRTKSRDFHFFALLRFKSLTNWYFSIIITTLGTSSFRPVQRPHRKGNEQVQ